jgi:DNA repair exonuclease SbcCD ATPase subunit
MSASKEQLLAAIARQNQMIDSLHGAARRYKSRCAALQTTSTEIQAQLDMLSSVSAENSELRATIDVLQRKCNDFQGVVHNLSERASTDVDSGAALVLRNRALERQIEYLREELTKRSAAAQVIQAECGMAKQQVADRDERIHILLSRSSHRGAPKNELPEAYVAELTVLKKDIATLSTQNSIYQTRLAQAQEDLVRKDTTQQALQRELKALKMTISTLVGQVSGNTGPAATTTTTTPPKQTGGYGTAARSEGPSVASLGSISPMPLVPPTQQRLKRYHEQQQQQPLQSSRSNE